MQINTAQANKADILVEPGETMHFGYKYLQTPEFNVHAQPSLEAFMPRLLAGKLWEGHCTAFSEPIRLRLGGDNTAGVFTAIRVDAGKTFLVRLRHLAAYSFQQDGGFVSTIRLWDPVCWLIGLTFPLLVRGPAYLLFYGMGLECGLVTKGDHCFADQVIGFNGATIFRVSALRPMGAGGDVVNAFSQTIDMEFCEATQVIRATVRGTNKKNWAKRIAHLLFVVVLGGWLIEKLLLEDRMWSWIR